MALNPKVAWAVHAMAHVHYERGDNARGIEALPPRIHPCDHLGYFKNHLLWHLALMHLAEGRYERVKRLFQSVFGDIPITAGSDLQDSVSLGGSSTCSAIRTPALAAPGCSRARVARPAALALPRRPRGNGARRRR
jgi:hypothetical protein